MARPVRIDFPGARHHVMNRGLRQGPVFIDDWCCQEFIALLPETVERFEIIVHGYALMPNHYHLLVESTHGNLSRAMAYVSATFSRRLNTRFHWDGSIFRGRFHNRVVTAPEHWHHLLAYIHLNPLKARLIMSLEKSRWTSHAAYAHELSCPDWLHTDFILSKLGGVEGYRQYIEDIHLGRRRAPESFDEVLFRRRRASEAFIVKQEDGERSITPDKALIQVQEITGASADTLTQTQRGRRGNPPRAVAAWWLTHGAGLTNVSAGEHLAMSPVAVTKALRWVENQLATDATGDVYRWILLLKDLKGQ